MKKFVVAYISFMDNELKMQEYFTSLDELGIMKLYMSELGYDVSDTSNDIEGFKQFAFDCDSMISVLEV